MYIPIHLISVISYKSTSTPYFLYKLVFLAQNTSTDAREQHGEQSAIYPGKNVTGLYIAIFPYLPHIMPINIVCLDILFIHFPASIHES